MKINGKPYRTIWLNQDGKSVEIIDQTKLPHRFETVTLRTLEDAARAISTMQVRGAPLDRRHCGLRRCAWLARPRYRRGARPRLRDAGRHASDRHQSALGARRDAEGGAQPAARQARRRRFRPRGRNLRRGCRDQPENRRARARDHPRACRQEERRCREHPHPLQCRLARLRRLGHGAGADLPRA